MKIRKKRKIDVKRQKSKNSAICLKENFSKKILKSNKLKTTTLKDSLYSNLYET